MYMRVIFEFQQASYSSIQPLIIDICHQTNIENTYTSDDIPSGYREILEQYSKSRKLEDIKPLLDKFMDLKLFGGIFTGRFSVNPEFNPAHIPSAVIGIHRNGKFCLLANDSVCQQFGVSQEELDDLVSICQKLDIPHTNKKGRKGGSNTQSLSISQNKSQIDISLNNPDICIASSGIWNMGRGENAPTYDIYFLPLGFNGKYINIIAFNYAWANEKRTTHKTEFLKPFKKRLLIQSVFKQNGFQNEDFSSLEPEQLLSILRKITASKNWSDEAIYARDKQVTFRTFEEVKDETDF